MNGLWAGTDVRTITPSLQDLARRPVFLAGFQGDRRATGLMADLHVRTLALRGSGDRPFVLAVCDLIGLLSEETLTIRAEVADLGADVVVATTHTHSGPDVIGLWGSDGSTSGVEERYLAELRATVAASIRAAVAATEPAVLRAAATTVPGVIHNYRDPEILDEAVSVLAFDRPDGSAITTLVNVGVHPEVLDGGSTLISPDMAGACCTAIETDRGGTAVWASGDLGGMQSPTPGPRTPDEVGRKGREVAIAALRAIEGLDPSPDPRVRYAGGEVRLPLWNPRYRAAIEAGLVRARLDEDGWIVTDVGVLDLGAARATCWPGEVLPKLGIRMREVLATPVPLLIGLANDELGYILPQEDFEAPSDLADPGDRYEESMSVGPETGPSVFAALEQLIAEATG